MRERESLGFPMINQIKYFCTKTIHAYGISKVILFRDNEEVKIYLKIRVSHCVE